MPTRPDRTQRNCSLADRFGSFYVGLGFLISWGVGLALAFPLDPLDRWLPPAFIPTIDELLNENDWRLFLPHYLYSLYGVLLMSLGALVRKRVDVERERVGMIGVFEA